MTTPPPSPVPPGEPREAEVAPAASPPAPPERVGRYRVVRVLGSGGMGQVYLAEDETLGREVAVKVMRPQSEEGPERFVLEARTVAALNHPNIVVLHDFGMFGERPYLVMERLEGESLDVWAETPRAVADKLAVLRDLCRALDYAHRRGVLHRDLKLSNVQVLPDGSAKLMDFGIAQSAAGGAGSRMTATGIVLGTPEFIAPELLAGGAYSPRSDLYAFGVVAYQLFADVQPFRADNLAACLQRVLHHRPLPLRSLVGEVPEAVARAIDACLEKDPLARPSGADRLLAVFAGAVGASGGVLAVAPGLAPGLGTGLGAGGSGETQPLSGPAAQQGTGTAAAAPLGVESANAMPIGAGAIEALPEPPAAGVAPADLTTRVGRTSSPLGPPGPAGPPADREALDALEREESVSAAVFRSRSRLFRLGGLAAVVLLCAGVAWVALRPRAVPQGAAGSGPAGELLAAAGEVGPGASGGAERAAGAAAAPAGGSAPPAEPGAERAAGERAAAAASSAVAAPPGSGEWADRAGGTTQSLPGLVAPQPAEARGQAPTPGQQPGSALHLPRGQAGEGGADSPRVGTTTIGAASPDGGSAAARPNPTASPQVPAVTIGAGGALGAPADETAAAASSGPPTHVATGPAAGVTGAAPSGGPSGRPQQPVTDPAAGSRDLRSESGGGAASGAGQAAAAAAAPAETPPPAVPAPQLEEMSPELVRRGSSATLVLRLAAPIDNPRVEVRRGRRPAQGIRVLGVETRPGSGRNPGELAVRLLVDEDAPLGACQVVVIAADGRVSNALSFEVEL